MRSCTADSGFSPFAVVSTITKQTINIDTHHTFRSLVATVVSFLHVSKPAGWLLVPYQCSVGFASVLNGIIRVLN